MGRVVKWNEEDLRYLINNFEDGDRKEITKRLNRSWKSIRGKANELGLKRNEELWKKGKPWTDEQIEYLKNNYKTTPVDEIAKVLGRSRKSIFEKASILGLSKDNYKIWTEEDLKYLKENYPTNKTSDVAQHLNRSEHAVRLKAEELGIRKQKKIPKSYHKSTKVRTWTPEEEEYLRKHYPTEDVALIAKRLNRTPLSVYGKANYLGIKRGSFWTDKEVDILKFLYLETRTSVKEIARILNRTEKSVKGKLSYMGLYRYGKFEPWTSKQIEYLKNNFGRKTRFRIAAELGRTPGSISTYASTHEIKSHKISFKHLKNKGFNKNWEDWEISYLLECYDTTHWTKMKKVLKRSKASIICKMRRLGIFEKSVKKYVGRRFIFYYRTEEEKKQKIDYISWWRDIFYVESESDRDRIIT